MKEFKASISISASPSEVWQVLTDFDHYPDWNPMLTHIKGTAAVGQSLDIKMRLPSRLMCGTPGTHYFQLTSSHGGTQTELTQGKKYEGWGIGVYAAAGSIESARLGAVAMNTALSFETARRKQGSVSRANSTGSGRSIGSNSGTRSGTQIVHEKAVAATTTAIVNEKDNTQDENENMNSTVEDLDISDTAAVAAATAAAAAADISSSTKAEPDPEPEQPEPKPEKRVSLISAGLSSLFGGGGGSKSNSKDDLLSSSAIIVEADEHGQDGKEDEEKKDQDGEDDEDDDDQEGNNDSGFDFTAEDPEVKRQREAKNAERIELDLGGGSLSMAEFGL
ncbi:hypothetical protein BGZ94_003149 [Podila epigama]|nr:hypothetical protein BGZ94_003149 [Podila epigama]